MRETFAALIVFVGAAGLGQGCTPTDLRENWTCDWDSSVARPLSTGTVPSDDSGKLPAAACKETCGPPVESCTRTTLDGGVPGAICPVCTF
jgi:hypothetical protein